MAKDCPSSWFRYFHLFHSIWMRRHFFSDLKHCWPQICREGTNHTQMKICSCDILQNLGKVSLGLRFVWWLLGCGFLFGFFSLLLLSLQLITFQISAEPRTELRYQIYFSKQSTASCSSKKVHFCLFFHSKSFPYMSSFLNKRDNWAWKGFALKCQCCLFPLLFISAFWPEFSDLVLWES